MQLETINKLYLELSQVATAQTAKEIALRNIALDSHDLCRSALMVAERQGVATDWEVFAQRLNRHIKASAALLA